MHSNEMSDCLVMLYRDLYISRVNLDQVAKVHSVGFGQAGWSVIIIAVLLVLLTSDL